MFGVVAVGAESSGTGGSIGCTSLLRFADQTMVSFSLRDWREESWHVVRWELIDPDTERLWTQRGGGAGGSPRQDGRGSYDGEAWFDTGGTSHVEIRASAGDETLLSVDVELRELTAVRRRIDVVDLTDRPDGWELVMEQLTSFHHGPPVADVVAALSCATSRVGNYEVTPIAVECWGELSRLVVHVTGELDTPEFSGWWQLRIDGRTPQWALLHHLGSAPHGAVGYLLFADPMPERVKVTSSRWRSLLGGRTASR